MIKELYRFCFWGISLISASNIYAQRIMPTPYGNSQVNFIRTWDATSPQKHPDTLAAKSSRDSKQITEYFDGLGRPIQTVIKQGSLTSGSTAVDFVIPTAYDELGREQYKYLAFAANSTGGNSSISDGAFKINPFQQDSTFNKNQFPDDSWYYSQTNFEQSPLNRELEKFAPGNSWVGSASQSIEINRHSLKIKYWVNTITDSVRIWKVTNVSNAFGTYDTGSFYNAGMLNKLSTLDENNNQIIEFKDKEGKLILKKLQLTATSDTGSGKGYSGWLCTYFIYDDLNQLRCVIQPTGVKLLLANSWNINALSGNILNEQCYRYEYDYRKRVIMKKVPGSGTAYLVYDNRDHLVMTQDSVQRAAHKWMYMQYDELNRATTVGFITDNTNYNNPSYHWIHADTSTTTYPNLGSYTSEELSKTFYDDYSWRSGEGNPLSDTRNTSYDSYLQTASTTTWPYPEAVTQSSQLKNMVTGFKAKIIGSSNTFLYSVTFYDEKGRAIQAQATNITGGLDITTTQYTFAGETLFTVIKNEKSGTNSQTTVALTQHTYDDLNRLIKVEKKISNTKINNGAMPGSWKTILQNEYNALTQLKKTKVGSTPVDSLAYDFNIRGWPLGVNRDYVKDTTSTSNWFGFDLAYDKTSFSINGSSKSYSASQYNGNINGTLWKSNGDDEIRKYDFAYDAVNRLTSADFNQLTNNSFSKSAGVDFSVNGLNYDENGNILSIFQKGWKVGGSITIDSLIYAYINNGSKLKNVVDLKNDTATKLSDFRSSKAYMDAMGGTKNPATAIDYSYDPNGNINLDNNKDISLILYNYLNLPDSIRINGKGTIKYTYDASGNKLKKVLRDSTVTPVKVTTTLYLFGNFINDTLQSIVTENGRVRPKDSTAIVYDYFVKDHLGNVRMMLTEDQQTDMYPACTMELTDSTINKKFYSNVNTTRNALPSGYPTDTSYSNPNNYVSKVNGGGNKIGIGIVLKVMAGDKFNLGVSSWYKKNGVSPGTPQSPVTDIISALTGNIGSISTHGSSTEIQATNVLNPGALSFYGSHNSADSTTKPKAFINWVLFDDRFNYVSGTSGFEQVGADNTLTVHSKTNMPITKNGYLYIYVSNETPNIDVFFDNLIVTHVRGPLLEETHYYPFGLSMYGISSKALNFGSPDNKFKYSSKEDQANEFSDGSGLEEYDYEARMYDKQTGRWNEIDPLTEKAKELSPYAFVNNNPLRNFDPDGMEYVGYGYEGDNEEAVRSGQAIRIFGPDIVVKTENKVTYNQENGDKITIVETTFETKNPDEGKEIKVWKNKKLIGTIIIKSYADNAVLTRNRADPQTGIKTKWKEWGVFIRVIFKNNKSVYKDFQWIQSATTNEDEGCGTGPYNDPCDDNGNKPFYDTKADRAAGLDKEPGSDSRFFDRPARLPDPTRTVTWNAELTLVGRNAKGKYEDLITIHWGFTVNVINGVNVSIGTKIIQSKPSQFQQGLINQAKNK